MRSWKKPTPEQVRKASVSLSRPETASYFFGKLENPLWIQPLRDSGYFENPPPEQREKDSVSFPVWPAARYLVRMAAYGRDEARAAVAAVVSAKATNNHMAHLSYVEVALAAPADVAVTLARAERLWLRQQTWLFALLPEKYGELAVHLVLGGCRNEAVRLAHALLSFLGDPGKEAGHGEPKARFDTWHYGEVLKRVVPALVKVDALLAINLLCNLLFDWAKREAHVDSIGWRPAIEESSQNRDLDSIEDLLVDATRDACESAVRTGSSTLAVVLGELTRRRAQGIFPRLALHLLRVFREQAGELLQEELLDTSRLHSRNVRHEYSLLMRDGFVLLAAGQRDSILRAITAGPGAEPWDLSIPEQRSEFERFSRMWKRDRLAVIRDALPPGQKAVYEGLVEELGAPEDPEFEWHRPAIWHGPQSPKTAEELGTMSFDALVEYLVVWRPIRDFMAPSPEGLGRVLERVVAADPQRFAQEEAKLHQLHPTYVRSIVSGLAAALRAGKVVDHVAVLTLVGWCVSQSELPHALPGEFTDRDWEWTRRAVLDVLTAGMGAKVEFAISARDAVWFALSPLLDDPHPTPEQDGRDAQSFEPADLALNSVRGSAMLALVQYALWVRRWQEKQPDAERRVVAGLAELPEVREALDAHLDPGRDPSLAVLSVYGQWFPWLVLLDKAWARTAAPRVFPLTEPERFEAAWLTYLAHNRPYRDVASMLHDQYMWAAGSLGCKSRIRVRSWRPPAEALGQHLLAMYAQGWIGLDDSALVLFFDRADVDTRVHVLASIGRDLSRSDADASAQADEPEARVPFEVVESLKTLWEARLGAPGRDKRESAAFGWWFASGVFEESWAWKHLIAAVQEVGSVEGLMFLAKSLGVEGVKNPRDGVKVLSALIANLSQPWTMLELKEAIRPVLTAALSADDDTRRAAVHILNRLGERGFTEYKDLVPITWEVRKDDGRA